MRIFVTCILGQSLLVITLSQPLILIFNQPHHKDDVIIGKLNPHQFDLIKSLLTPKSYLLEKEKLDDTSNENFYSGLRKSDNIINKFEDLTLEPNIERRAEKSPYVETSGQKDYLVMENLNDPVPMVVPNQIYYNIEKGCANWLDNCNLQGVKANLLDRIRYT